MIKSLQYNYKKSRYKGNKFIVKKNNNNDLQIQKICTINTNKTKRKNKNQDLNINKNIINNNIDNDNRYKRNISLDSIKKENCIIKNTFNNFYKDISTKGINMNDKHKKSIEKKNQLKIRKNIKI